MPEAAGWGGAAKHACRRHRWRVGSPQQATVRAALEIVSPSTHNRTCCKLKHYMCLVNLGPAVVDWYGRVDPCNAKQFREANSS